MRGRIFYIKGNEYDIATLIRNEDQPSTTLYITRIFSVSDHKYSNI